MISFLCGFFMINVICFLFSVIFFMSNGCLYGDVGWMDYKCSMQDSLKVIPGWTSCQKAEAMMDLIFKIKPAVCVELGVFAGASIFPTALALKYIGNGTVYGIDAWDTEEATKYYEEHSSHKDWWKQLDMNSYHAFCINLIEKNELYGHCQIIKKTFKSALEDVNVIDILHIDASHTKEGDFIDILPFCEKVRDDGYIWFDGWATSSLLYQHLKKDFLVKKVIDSGNCILLQKNCKK